MSQGFITISIIIPTHQYTNDLKACLHAIQETEGINKHEIIIVLDGLKNKDAFFDQFSFQNLRIFEVEINQGPANARNLGAKKAKGDILFFVDSDVVVHKNTIPKVEEHFLNKNATDALIGSYDDEPKHQSIVSKYRNLLHHYVHQHASEKATTFWGACGAVKKDIFLSLNGFSTQYKKASIEDIEFGYRLIKNDYSIKLDKTVFIKHLKKWTLKSVIHTDVLLRAKPWTILIHQYKDWLKKELNNSLNEKITAVLVLVLVLVLPLSIFHTSLFYVALLMFTLVCCLKFNTYRFFLTKFSFLKVPIVIILHWIYLLCALIGYFLGTLAFVSVKSK